MRDVRILTATVAAGIVLIGCGSHATESSIVPSYGMGERAPAGALIYTAFETKWAPQLGEGINSRIPSNRFFLIRLSVVNSGSGEAAVPTLTLVGDNGERFQELSDGDGVPQWTGFLRRLKPADTLSGYVLFDVPARHYKLEVSDESERKALIDIPLAFTEAPVLNVPIPESPGAPPKKAR